MKLQSIWAVGDLSKLCSGVDCKDKSIVVVNEKSETIKGKIESVLPQGAVVSFTAPITFRPSRVIVLNNDSRSATPAAILTPRDMSSVLQRRVTIRGDFHAVTNCTSGYLTDASLNTVDITVSKTTERTAMIAYYATSDFSPDTATLSCDPSPVTVPFVVFRGTHQTVAAFVSREIDDNFCGGPCKNVKAEEMTASGQPYDPDVSIAPLRITEGRVWVDITAPPEYAASTLTLEVNRKDQSDAQIHHVTLAKRLLGPLVDDHRPFVTYTVMDSETEKRDFGRRISNNYFAINVQIHNPTEQKIQLNKSRLWFDCDYVTISPKELYSNKFHYLAAGDPPVSNSGGQKDSSSQPLKGRRFIFGIDHEQRQFPHTLPQIIGAFDAQTGKEQAVFDGGDLAGSILSALTGVFDTTQYAVSANVFTGIFVPGLRKIVMSPDAMNQKRALLTSQAMDSYVQVASKGAGSTLVFLPRKGILAWQDTQGRDEQIPVVIDLIRDVHFEPEIVTDLAVSTATMVTAGMTEDDVKRICGEPATRTESNGTLTYTYSYGPIKEVDFTKDRLGVWRVATTVERPLSEQLVEGRTTVSEALRLLGGSSSELLEAVDGGKIWRNPKPITTNLRFGADNILKSHDYKLAADVLGAMDKPKIGAVKQNATELALDDTTKKKINDAFTSGGKDGSLTIPSPDIKAQFILIQYTGKQMTEESLVTAIK